MKLNKILSIPRSLFFNIKWFGLGGGGKTSNSNIQYYKSKGY